jgi:hypothetical protein
LSLQYPSIPEEDAGIQASTKGEGLDCSASQKKNTKIQQASIRINKIYNDWKCNRFFTHSRYCVSVPLFPSHVVLSIYVAIIITNALIFSKILLNCPPQERPPLLSDHYSDALI